MRSPAEGGVAASPALTVIRALVAAALIVAAGYFIALKIFHIPSRMEIVAFVTLTILVPVAFRPRIGIYALLLLLLFVPFFRRLYYLAYDRPQNDLLIILPDILVALLLIVVLDRVRKREVPWVENPRIFLYFGCFAGYSLLRIFLANPFGAEEGIYKFKFAVFYGTCILFGPFFITEKGQVVRLLRLTGWLGFFIGLYAIKQAYLGYSDFEMLWLEEMRTRFVTLFVGGLPRPFSTLASPAALADFMVFGMIAATCLVQIPGQMSRLFFVIAMPVMGFALALTSVRSNWVAFLAGAAFWFIIAHRSSMKVKLFVMGLFLMILFLVSGFIDQSSPGPSNAIGPGKRPAAAQTRAGGRDVTDIFFSDRVSAIAAPMEEHSMKARRAMWLFTYKRSLGFPKGILGSGLGGYDAHSYYFTTLFDTGWVGLILFLALLINIFRVGFRIFAEEEEADKKIMIRGILTLLFSVSVMNATGSHISSHPADGYFWLFAGILLVIRRFGSGESKTQDPGQALLVDPT